MAFLVSLAPAVENRGESVTRNDFTGLPVRPSEFLTGYVWSNNDVVIESGFSSEQEALVT